MTENSFGGYARPGSKAHALQLDLNEAPRDATARFRRRLLDVLAERSWRRYPDIDGARTRDAAATLYGWERRGTLVGNGSNELLAAVVRALLPRRGRMLVLRPSFSMYPILARRAGAVLEGVPVRPPSFEIDEEELLTRAQGADLVVLASPNNPTGGEISEELLARVLELGPPVVWDAAYVDFTAVDPRRLLRGADHLIVLRSLSKAWALAGLRVGALLSDGTTVERVAAELLPFDTGWLVDAAFTVALEMPEEREALVREIAAERDRLLAGLRDAGWEAVDSAGNFFLLRRPGLAGDRLRHALDERGVAVRDVPELTADGYVRVTVGTPDEDDRLLDALGEVTDG